MTNTEIDRELAEALGCHTSPLGGYVQLGESQDDYYYLDQFSPTTDPAQFIKLQTEYDINTCVYNIAAGDYKWEAFIADGEHVLGENQMIAGCLALIEALKEK